MIFPKIPIIFAALILFSGPAISGDLNKIKEPTKTQGVKLKVLEQAALVEQIPSMKGYDFRARMITFAPGAAFTRHNHATRPGFVYVLKGEIIESRNGKTRRFKAGDTWYEDASTDHWLRNISDKPVTFLMVDLPKKK